MHRSSSRRLRTWIGLLAALVVAVATVVGPSAPADRAEASVTVSQDRQVLARTLVDAHAAGTFRVFSPTFVDRMIAPTAAGQEPPAGCRLATSVLQTLVLTLQHYGSIWISSLARSCSGTQGANCSVNSGSMHCSDPGRAIDFVGVGNVMIKGGPESIPLLRFLDTFVPHGSRAGQPGCGSAVPLTNITVRFADTCNHLHLDLPDVPVNAAGAPAPPPSAPAPAVGNGQLLQIFANSQGWHTGNSGVPVARGTFSAVRVGSQGWPQVMANESGVLMQIAAMPGWTKLNTGLHIGAGASLGAVDMGGGWPQVLANSNGALLQIYANSGGWHMMNTGLRVSPGAKLSAVRVGAGWPQAMINDAGRLLQLAVMNGRWTLLDTGIRIPAGANLSAVHQGGPWPQVMVNSGGALLQVYADSRGWHVGNSGIRISPDASISAVNMGGGWPQVIVNEGGRLSQVWVNAGTWVKWDTGRRAAPNAAVSAVNMGGGWPQIMTAN